MLLNVYQSTIPIFYYPNVSIPTAPTIASPLIMGALSKELKVQH
jgi:hypothetical protein